MRLPLRGHFCLSASKVVGIEKPQGLTGIATGIIDDQRKCFLVGRSIGAQSFFQHLDEFFLGNTTDEQFADTNPKVLFLKEVCSVHLEKGFSFGQKMQDILN